jgi:hypothetical protein
MVFQSTIQGFCDKAWVIISKVVVSNIELTCGATKLECTFDYKIIQGNYVPIIVCNCLIIVSASDIQQMIGYQQKIHQ